MAELLHTRPVAFRATPAQVDLIRTASERDGRTVSSFVRRAVLQAIEPPHAAHAAPTDSGPFCRPISGQSDQNRVPTQTPA